MKFGEMPPMYVPTDRQRGVKDPWQEESPLDEALEALDDIGAVPNGMYGGPRAAKARAAAQRIRERGR